MWSLAENLRVMSLVDRVYTIEAPISDVTTFDGKKIALVTMADSKKLMRTSRK